MNNSYHYHHLNTNYSTTEEGCPWCSRDKSIAELKEELAKTQKALAFANSRMSVKQRDWCRNAMEKFYPQQRETS